MPCIAMWIPVVFLWDKNSKRCAWLSKYIPVYDYVHLGIRTRTQFKKLTWSDKIPFLNIKIRYDFNIIDTIYNIIFKLYTIVLYKIGIRKIDWDINMPNIEKHKENTKKNIQKSINNALQKE
jgi:hypothetical protein